MPVVSTRVLVDGARGKIEVAATLPSGAPRAIAVIAHPHPLFGGTVDNNVVTTVARAWVEAGAGTFRFNFRGVGATEGTHDEGRGETDDCLAVAAYAQRTVGALPLWLAGLSFCGAGARRAGGRGGGAGERLRVVCSARPHRAPLPPPDGSRLRRTSRGSRSALGRRGPALCREHGRHSRRQGRDRAPRGLARMGRAARCARGDRLGR